jgi:tetratricopeptide (TPR) repeat protein
MDLGKIYNKPESFFGSWLVFCIIIFIPWYTAAGQTEPSVPKEEDKCFSHYYDGEYEKSADCLNSILYKTKKIDTLRLVKCYEYLGVCHMMMDKKEPARAAFGKLLDLNPAHELNPTLYLPEVIAIFQMVKFEKKTSLKVLILDTIPAYSPFFNFLPCGTPQFLNKQNKKGAALLTMQVLAMGLSIYGYNKERSFYSEGAGLREENADKAINYNYMLKISFFTFVGAYVYSLADGFLNKRITIKD